MFSSLTVELCRRRQILRNLHFDRNQLLLINQIHKSSSAAIIAQILETEPLLIKRFSPSRFEFTENRLQNVRTR